jgi:hypothetical protein
MSSRSRVRSEFPADWAAEPPIEQPAPPRRASRPIARFLITFGLGVAATLAWQSYGDTAREIVAASHPQLGWLAPRAAAAQAAPDPVALAIPAADPQEIKLGLAAMRERMDRLATQLTAGQDQMTRDITARLQTAERDILDKISAAGVRQDAAALARKPAAPQASSQPQLR